MKALILAAGEGKRLRPLTYTRPKVMVEVAGKPILHHLLIELKKIGVNEAFLVVKYHKEKVIGYFQKKEEEIGMKINFIEQGEEWGTASAILSAEGKIEEPFLCLAGDIITEASAIKPVIEHAYGDITMAVKRVGNPSEYGVVKVNKEGEVIELEEKPKNPKSDLANLSIYYFKPGIFQKIKKIEPSPRGEREITDVLIGARAVQAEGFWMDIGYPWHLFDANEYLLSKMEARVGEVENSTINGKVIMEEGAKIINSTIEGTVYIGKNSVIGPYAIIRGTTSIGDNCKISGGTTVKNSIIGDGVNAKHLSYIGDSVIGEEVNFGSGTQLANYRFDGKNINVYTERGWRNSGRKKLGAFVGDETKFGVNSTVMPGKVIGNGCWIGANVLVNRNIEPKAKVFLKQEWSYIREG